MEDPVSRKSIGIIGAILLATALPAALAQSPAAAGTPKTAAEAFKNIQILKDAPADQIFPAMQFITASLGVNCEFCHVRNAFEKDDKEEKRTARKMMTMMFAINKDNFGDEREVTCYTCHAGAAHPTSVPVISEPPKPEPPPGMNGPGGSGAGSAAAAAPGADAILDKYVQEIGGEDALHKITTRVEKGTLSGMGPGGMPVEVFAKAPDARVTVVHGPRGENVTAYNGQTGWMSGFGPPRPITGGELDNEKRNADFYFASDIKQAFQQISNARLVSVSDLAGLPAFSQGEAYLLVARSPGKPPVRFYFDKDSGLLLREVRYVETPLGRNPSQVDYADYRDVDGVKIPFKWTIARPGGRFTIQIDQVQQNVPIDESKFAEPSAPSPGAKPPSP